VTAKELLDLCLGEQLIDLTISNPKKKNIENQPIKIKVRPVILKDHLEYQMSEYIGTKVFHQNYDKQQLTKKVICLLTDDYKQAQFTMTDATAQILSGKNGNMNVKYKKTAKTREQKELSHNRTKKYILSNEQPVPFLIDLGVMTSDGKIITQKYDKFRQINRFLEFIEDIIPMLDKNHEQTIIDFGCGKSYLTFAMYHYLKEIKGYDIRIIGLDLKEDVINTCNALKDKYHYDKLDFYKGDIASYTDVDHVDMVVTLHACDTATDHALFKAVKWGAKVILSVPCCQHEANAMIQSEMLAPVLKYGILKERMSAIFTDAIRAEILEGQGYDTQIIEFIDLEHTPKNLLIRAVKKTGSSGNNEVQQKAMKLMRNELNLNLTLNQLFERDEEYNEEQ
jgi:SAM-dependent methyltransferase